jgi:hypothetical protein
MISSQSGNFGFRANPTVRVLRLLRNALPRAGSQLEWQAALGQGHMASIEELTTTVKTLGAAVDRWNSAMTAALVLAALAAIAVVVTTRLALVRARELGDKQTELIKAKDADLADNLKAKDVRIAESERKAAEARERTEHERTARLALQRQLAARRLTGSQKDELSRALRGRPDAVAIVSTMLDGEGSDLADDFEAAIRQAGWQVQRIKNHISNQHGMRLGSVEGTNLIGTKDLARALGQIGIQVSAATFRDGDASTSPPFQSKVIYLVIDRKPEPRSADLE